METMVNPTKWHQVFGMNRRNRDFVYRWNLPAAIALANDKIACKKALSAEGLPVPARITEVHRTGDARGVLSILRKLERGFVVKPSNGCQGNGVSIFSRAQGDQLVLQSGRTWSIEQFIRYLCRIISGEFSMGRPCDSVLIEERIECDSDWIMPGLPGAPDLRVIVFEGRPVLAMSRIPTRLSGGKANLHCGGVGVGIALASGRTTHAICRERPILNHPDTRLPLVGHIVQQFDECLELAARCARAVPLGYMGVDIMRHRENGPCVIEVNARPGLAIQLANRMGLAAAIESSGSAKKVTESKETPKIIYAGEHV